MFAESGKIILRSAREAQKRRIRGLETDRVADDVAPEAGACGQHHGILDARHDFRSRVPRGMAAAELSDRNKFKKEVGVGKNPKRVKGRVWRGKESFGGGICFEKTALLVADNLAKQITIRLKPGSAMNDEP